MDEGRNVNFEEFSIEELERHHQWLKRRIQQAGTAAKANTAIAKLESEVEGLGEAEIKQGIEASQSRIKQLKLDLDEAVSQHMLKQQALDTISMSTAGYNQLLPLPESSELGRRKKPVADKGNGTVELNDLTDLYTSPTAKEMCRLVVEQARLSSCLLGHELEARRLEDQCLELRVKIAGEHPQHRKTVAQWKAKQADNFEAHRKASAEAAKDSDDEKLQQERLHRYTCRVIVLRHILQSLILGSNLDWPDLDKWQSVALECGNLPDQD